LAIELIFETHSLTEDNEKGIASGWLPGRLSRKGRALAAELGDRRRDDGISAIFVSDLARAIQTVEIAFRNTTIPVHLDARLRECDYGELNGCPVPTLSARRSRHIDQPFPGGQSYRQVVHAMESFLADLVKGWDGRRLLAVGHSANKWALDHLLNRARIEDLVDAPFGWKEGWTYIVR
jgi:broad specificity phosphatase PhoE